MSGVKAPPQSAEDCLAHCRGVLTVQEYKIAVALIRGLVADEVLAATVKEPSRHQGS
jgi:hypothetical protein